MMLLISMYRQGKEKGFIMIEVMLASFLLGLAVLALCHISSRATLQTLDNYHSQIALEVLDKQLSMIESMGVDDFRLMGIVEGVNEDYETPYIWRVQLTDEGIGNLYRVVISVSWKGRHAIKSVSATTMFNVDSTSII